VWTSAAASDISLRTSARCSAASVTDARRDGGGSVRLVSLECLEVVPAPISEIAAHERVPLEPGRRFFAAIHRRRVGHMPGRFDHRGGEVLPAPSEAGECGASFAFAATVGSVWRATPQTGQRLKCAEFSWYGPRGVRQLQCHSPGFSLIRRLGWTFELNTTKTALLIQRGLWRRAGSGPCRSSLRSVAGRARSRRSSAWCSEARRPEHRVGAIADRQLGRIDAVGREPRLDRDDDLDDRP
jgi:hypothetical protein